MSWERQRRTQARAGQRCPTAEETGERAASNLHRQFLGGNGAGRKDRFGDRGGGHVSGRMEHGAFPAGQTLIERIESFPHEFDGAVLLATPDISCARQGNHSLDQPQT
jgi:hypothetical protein